MRVSSQSRSLLLVALVVLTSATSQGQDFTQLSPVRGGSAATPEANAALGGPNSANLAMAAGDGTFLEVGSPSPWLSQSTDLHSGPDIRFASFATHSCHEGCYCNQQYVPDPTTSPDRTQFRFPSYDPTRGIKILDPVDPACAPFSLNFSGNAEFRYAGFMRSEEFAIDASGATQEIKNLQGALIPRMWFQFDGFIGKPNILYNFILFGSTGGGDSLSVLGGPGYKFSENLTVYGAVLKMPSTREWAESYRWHFGVDRSMATTFFRPSFTPGMFAYGKIGDTVKYAAAITNGINGVEFNTTRPGNNMAFALSPTWEPLGDYGPGFNDVEYHEDLVLRFGTSLSAAPNTTIDKTVGGNPDNTLVRLSDGTDLSDTGALGGSSVVTEVDWYLAAIDLGFKYRGHSISAEYFYRYLDDIDTTGGPPSRSTLNDRGGYLYGALSLCPRYLELIGKTGFVSGPYGSSEEYGGGVNWYLTGNRRQRLVFEAIHYNGSPAENDVTPYRAFFSGTVAQMEYYVQF